jgi:hypothetical protein
MVAMGRRSVCCGAGSGASARCSGGCWPTSLTVALAGVAASGASTRSGSGVAPPWSSRGRHPGAFPANLGPTERRSASHPMAGRAILSSGHACRWRVASAGPRLTLRASVPPEKGSSGLEDEGDAHRTGRPSQEHRHPDHPGGQSGLPQALQQVVEAAKLLFEADGPGSCWWARMSC